MINTLLDANPKYQPYFGKNADSVRKNKPKPAFHRMQEPQPRYPGVEQRLADVVAKNGVADGNKITLVSGHSAGGYEVAVHYTHTKHCEIKLGDVFAVGNGINKYYDKRGTMLKIESQADIDRLIAVMTHPRDPREVTMHNGTHDVTLGHNGVAGKTTSYNTTLDSLL